MLLPGRSCICKQGPGLSSQCILSGTRQAKTTRAYSERLQWSACTCTTSTSTRQGLCRYARYPILGVNLKKQCTLTQ